MHKIIKEERLCTNCRDSGTDPEKKNWPIWLCQRREKDPQVIPSLTHFLYCSCLFFPSLSTSSPPMFFSPSPTKPRHSSCQWVPWSPTRSLHVGIVIFFSKGFISWFFSHSITLFFFSYFSSFIFHFQVKYCTPLLPPPPTPWQPNVAVPCTSDARGGAPPSLVVPPLVALFGG